VALASLFLSLLSVVSAIGGPPSYFRQDVHVLLEVAVGYLLLTYGLGVALTGLGFLFSILSARVGRLVTVAGVAFTTLGNVLSALIGAGNETRGAVVLLLLSVPFLLYMWMPAKAQPKPASGGV
jgi:hypothetical protein